MDLSEGSIGWHRTRKWLDNELEALSTAKPYDEYHEGFLWGQMVAYMKMRPRFYTEEESYEAVKTRREMFG